MLKPKDAARVRVLILKRWRWTAAVTPGRIRLVSGLWLLFYAATHLLNHALGLVSQLVAPGQALSTARSAAKAACAFDREVQAQAKAFTKPLLQTELAAERALFLQMIQKPRVRAALADFVSRSDPMPYLARQPAEAAQTPSESEP